jgi:hypothetical protein
VGGRTTLILGLDSGRKFSGLLHNSNIGICFFSLLVVARFVSYSENPTWFLKVTIPNMGST